ncbi:hypothetical protein GCM10011494_34490 [Novosphingobium endophyticum]|uniref:Haemolysin-type calcium binding-related domain-containing protein n=1 Tax=Novosphingobium endophyticum TaxID=1955250 RepID=A0A916TW99_9SPHN|nr:calcium-binding protein [Novosphingobium endophyticum]GGC12757.1 hypothetical protein GCM10011494_34490 [Novosphingobium endophyticum]
MAFHPDNVEDGVFDSISGILGSYTDADAINAAIYGDLTGLNVESDVETVLQTYTDTNTSFWDELYIAPSGEYVGAAVSDITLGLTEGALVAQKGLTLTITNELKALVAQPVTIKTAVIEYFEGQPVKAYVDKATGLLVRSETVLSETTHIPVGKFLAGMGHAVSAYAIFETFKDTITASYNAALGQEDTFSPLQEYLIAGTAVIVGGAVAGGLVVAGAPAIFVAAGGSLAAGAAAWTADTVIGSLPAVVNAAKVAGKTLQQTLDDAYAEIQDTINDAWNATGTAAQDLLDDAQDLMDGLLDGIGDLLPGIDLPESILPGWLDSPLNLFGGAKNIVSPLIVDLDSDGIELTTFNSTTTTTFFDLDGDGFAQQTAWVSADDGLLARDINANGTIDDVSELFGSPTVDGFAKLSLLDDNSDLIIDSYDDAWADLVVWQDANGDAVSQSTELLSLGSLGIVSIDLAGVAPSTTTISGNAISHTSTFRYSNGSTDAIVDAWFVNDKVNSYYAGDFSFDIGAAFLPTLRGFGQVADLHVTMSLDGTLLGLVEDVATTWSVADWANSTGLDNDLADILYEWADVQDASPSTYGYVLDSRKLAFLEKLFGEPWSTQYAVPSGFNQCAAIHESWLEVFAVYKAAFLLQLGANSLFANAVTYDVFAGDFSGDLTLSETAIDNLIAHASATGVDTEEYWLEVARFLDAVKGLDNLTSQENTWVDDAIYASDNMLTWTGIKDQLDFDPGFTSVSGTGGDDTLYGDGGINLMSGSGGNDTYYASGGDDTITGSSGIDTMYGEAGNDALDGKAGDDVLTGGDGDDTVEGGDGNDTYIYTSGRDWYSEYASGGADVIEMPSGIASGDLVISRQNEDDLVIEVGSLGQIEMYRWFVSANYQIETVVFADTSTLDLTAFTEMDFHGTEEADTLIGESTLDETIYGYGGDDELRGQGGDDTLDGGAGNDELWGYSGNDTYIFSAGFDTIKENSGTDTIIIPSGYAAGDLVFLKSGTDLIIQVVGLGQAFVDNHFGNVNQQIEEIYFSDAQSTIYMSNVSIEQRGGDGNDGLSGVTTGASSDDILNGMAGNDLLQGKLGNDTYVFSEGIDQITEIGGSDTLVFWEGWSPEEIDVYRQQSVGTGWDDLVIADQSGNKLTVESHFDYPSGNGELEFVEFSDSTTWTIAALQIETWGTSGNDSISFSGTTDRVIYGFAGNDTLNGSSGNDYLDGGDGDDTMRGYAGDDLMIYSAGLDTVTDTGGSDVLWITGGVTINDITVSNYGTNEAKIVIDSGVDEIQVNDLRAASTYHIETVKFDDGFYADLPSYNSWLNGTSGNDVVAGGGSAEVLIGFGGDDSIDAGAGDDQAHGGAGADTLTGGDGSDLLHGGIGDDLLYGEDGLDTLFGGSGADTFFFEAASAFNNTDVVSDFSTNDSDVIDIADVLDGYYTAGVDDITDFVQITDDGTDSSLAIDQDGTANGTNFVAVASILGATGLTDEAALVTSGALVVS